MSPVDISRLVPALFYVTIWHYVTLGRVFHIFGNPPGTQAR